MKIVDANQILEKIKIIIDELPFIEDPPYDKLLDAYADGYEMGYNDAECEYETIIESLKYELDEEDNKYNARICELEKELSRYTNIK